MLFGALFHCKDTIDVEDKYALLYGVNGVHGEGESCGGDVAECEVCKRCVYIFLSAALIGFAGVGLVYFGDVVKNH